MKLYPEVSNQLSPFLVQKYEDEASKLWDKFYQRNGVHFFKDRHYLLEEFPELLEDFQKPWILEVGCGVGNTCFPLLETLPHCQICAVDFSLKAVELLKQNQQFDEGRIQTRVLDLTEPQGDLNQVVNCPKMDFCSMIFFLSAVSPQKMPQVLPTRIPPFCVLCDQVIRNASALMKIGGRVLFRDYAIGDLAQIRFEESGRLKKLGDNFYLRGDGTRCFYFTEQFLKSLFQEEGFQCDRITIFNKQIENKGRNLTMDRKWMQAVFTKMM